MKNTKNEMPSDGCVLHGKCKVISDNRVDMPDFTRHLEDYFCKQTCHQCARFQVYEALGLDAIPALMLPDQYDWARQIIEEHTANNIPKHLSR